MIIKSDPKKLLLRQLKSFYNLEAFDMERTANRETEAIDKVYCNTLYALDYCFNHIKNKYYNFNGETIFNPLHVGQWTMFLYQIARQLKLYSADNTDLCDKIYGISKCFSSADIFYEVVMPKIWFFDHPQGSVMGRANYSDFFTFSQGGTVGNNRGKYPSFGRHVSMMSGSKVLGECRIGDHVIIAANAYVINQDIPSYTIVFGAGERQQLHHITPEKFNELTASMFDEKEIAGDLMN